MKFYALLAILAACMSVSAARAQAWPYKTIRLISTASPSAGADIISRIVAEQLAERIGQSIVVDNRSGAGGNIAMELAARADADGYTLLYALPPLVINPHLYKLSFNPLKDFVPVALIARYQFALLARPSFPASNPKALMALASANPGSVTCGYSGGNLRLGCALLGELGNVKITLVAYRSIPQIMADLLGGRIDLTFNAISSASGYVGPKGAIPIAVTSRRQVGNPLGDIPALNETLKGFDLTTWQGIVAPAGTPSEVIQRLNREIQAILEDEKIRRQLEARGVEVITGAPRVFGELMAREHQRYGRMIEKLGIRAE